MPLHRVRGHFFGPLASTSRGFTTPLCRRSPCFFRAPFLTRGNRSNNRSDPSPVPPRQQHPQPIANAPKQYFPPRNSRNAHDSVDEFANFGEIPQWEDFTPRVRYLRPAIWAISVSAGIYVFMAYLEAREDMKPKSWQIPYPQWQMQKRAPTPTEVVTGTWNSLDKISKVSWGIIGTSGVIHLGSLLAPKYWDMLWHCPARNLNFTLLSSVFVHGGPWHLLFNMWACYNFLPPVGYSRLFEGNPYHTLSFFLSAGVISSYAQHLATKFASAKGAIPPVFIRAGGASGALFGIFGVFAMQYPTAGMGIIFLPFYVDAQYFLPAVMLFDFVGMVRGYRFVNFGHAAHLSGALVGVAYSYFDGKENLWKPLVRFWKRRLQDK